MNRQQVIKILKVAIYCTAIMFAFDALFAHSVITNWLTSLVENAGAWAYVVVWVLMFVQVCFIPIPAYVVLVGAVNTSLISDGFLRFGFNDLYFYLTVITAYVAGCVVAYFMGYKWGRKAVKWCAGSDEDYEKWSNVLNTKGKWWYALTVLLPIFPDDLLCVVAGSVKFDFWFYLVVNTICRLIGLLCMVQFLILVGMMNGGGFPVSCVCWGVALLAEIITYIVLKNKNKKKAIKN